MRIALALSAILISGCMSTTVVLNPKWDKKVRPSYNDYVDGYFWGLMGSPVISLNRVCMDQKPYALRRHRTFEDILITAVTAGIYVPTTVKVWCGD